MSKKTVYLAIPYSGMQKSSYKQSLQATILGMNDKFEDVNIFSPILHSHPLKGLPQTWDFWGLVDRQYIEKFADELWVLIPKEGFIKVIESVGVQSEIQIALDKGIPINIAKINYGGLFSNKPLDLVWSGLDLEDIINESIVKIL